MNVFFLIYFSVIFFFLGVRSNTYKNTDAIEEEVEVTLQSIYKVLDFVEKFYSQRNLDTFFGITLAQAQIEQALNDVPQRYVFPLNEIRIRCQRLVDKYRINSQYIETIGQHDFLFRNVLLNSRVWYNNVYFKMDLLNDFGLHWNWTADDVMKNRSSSFNGLKSDQCLSELLQNNCQIGKECEDMMLGDRNDTLYVETHRLLFMQLARGIQCATPDEVRYYTQKFCSHILRDAKTIEYLDFPNMDLFLEQILLCGMEGYEDFFIKRWRTKPLIWQTEHGCYRDSPIANHKKYRRTAYIIEYGCIDHTTGLGLATLSLNVRYLMYTVKKV